LKAKGKEDEEENERIQYNNRRRRERGASIEGSNKRREDERGSLFILVQSVWVINHKELRKKKHDYYSDTFFLSFLLSWLLFLRTIKTCKSRQRGKYVAGDTSCC